MPFYVRDFQMATLGLEADELGVYLELIMLAWDSGDGSVTGDMNELKALLQRLIAHFHGHTFNRIVPKILGRYFHERDGRFYQERVENELKKARELSANATQNINKRWAGVRKSNTSSIPPYYYSHSHSHKERGGSRLKEGKDDGASHGEVWVRDTDLKKWEAWDAHTRATKGHSLRAYRGEGENRGSSGRYFPTPWPPSDKPAGGQAMTASKVDKCPVDGTNGSARLPPLPDHLEVDPDNFQKQTGDLSADEVAVLMAAAFLGEFAFVADSDSAISELANVDLARWTAIKQKVLARLAQMTNPGPDQALFACAPTVH
jgi:uncharacterized protein YdaU (DUF1376 family)